MGYEEVTDLGTENVIALGGFNKKARKDNPLSIEGYYLGSRQVPSKLSKTGTAAIHVFQTPKGNVGVWGKTDLDIKLSSVTPGTMTLVKFDKMLPTKTGEMYKYKVAVDKGNTIEVSGLPVGATNDSQDDAAEGYAATDADGDSDYNQEDVSQAAALLAAERKAKVEALLKGNKGR